MATRRVRSRSWSVRAIALALLVAGGMLAAPSVALAADSGGDADATDATVTWSVRPADDAGADARSWIEVELDPGEVHEEHLAITNHSAAPTVFRISAADGYLTETGRFNMLASSEQSTDAGTWVSVQETVALAAGETAVLPFRISVPEDASAGDHAAGIAASVLSEGVGEGGNRVSVESRVGFRVMTRVTGELTAAIDASDAQAVYRPSWNPFEPGALSVQLRVVNTGDVAVAVDDEVTGPGRLVDPAASAESTMLFPGDERILVRELAGVWPLLHVGGEITLTPIVEGVDVRGVDPITVEFSAWAMPLAQLALFVGAALVLSALLLGRRRQARRIERLVADAREEGRRSALA